jgi:hypothetical protein
MGSERALYWIAVSVLAVFVSNNFAVRHQDAVRCLASRSLVAIEQVSGHANGVIEMAETMLGRGEPRFDHAQMALDSVQTRLASAQCVLARHQAAFARVQAEHARMEAMQHLCSTMIRPRQNLRMAIPEPPSMRMDGTI